jgi:hypothetical protein
MSFYLQGCVTIFPLLASDNVLPKMPCNLLQPITYSKDWDSQLEDCWVDMWRISFVNRIRPTGEYDTFQFPGKLRNLLGTGQQFRVDIQLSQATCDEVGIL